MLFDPTRAWVHRGSCRTVDPERFFTVNSVQVGRTPSPAAQAAWDQAKKICSFCPVLEECRRDTLGEEFGVFGGRDEHERYLIRRQLYRRAGKWPVKLRLEWGKELSRLRRNDVSWTRIRAMTGMPDALATKLIEEWERCQAEEARRKAATVHELPAPKELPPLSELRDFPAAPGEKHAWVRHQHVVADAYYAGQTEDGQWLRMMCWSGHGMVFKWFRPGDVRFYHPQTPFIVQYPGRKKRRETAA